ncbi:MAG TPA: MFS transporter [Flavisolibacter sp.]
MAGVDLLGDRKKHRRFIALFFLFSGIIAATWSSRIADVQHKLQLSNSSLGTVLFAVPVGLVAGLSFSSWVVVRFGARKMMLLSCLLAAVFLALAGMADTPVLLMLVLFFLGICRTLLNLSANTAAIEVQELYDRPIIASFHGLWSLACFGAAGISAILLAAEIRPTIHFIVIAAVLIMFVLLLKGPKQIESKSAERRPFFVMPDKYLFLLGSMALCAMLCEGAVFDWSVNYFEKVIGAKRSLVITGYIAFIVMMAGGRLVGDRFIHLFGAKRIIIICGLLMASGFALAAAFPYLVIAALGFLLIGMGDSVLVPVIYMLASRSKKMPPSYALASVTLIGYTGFLIGPLLIGNVSEYLGMPIAFGILSGVSLVLVLLCVIVHKQTP